MTAQKKYKQSESDILALSRKIETYSTTLHKVKADHKKSHSANGSYKFPTLIPLNTPHLDPSTTPLPPTQSYPCTPTYWTPGGGNRTLCSVTSDKIVIYAEQK